MKDDHFWEIYNLNMNGHCLAVFRSMDKQFDELSIAFDDKECKTHNKQDIDTIWRLLERYSDVSIWQQTKGLSESQKKFLDEASEKICQFIDEHTKSKSKKLPSQPK